jgi:hypothetical protein
VQMWTAFGGFVYRQVQCIWSHVYGQTCSQFFAIMALGVK